LANRLRKLPGGDSTRQLTQPVRQPLMFSMEQEEPAFSSKPIMPNLSKA